MRPVARSMNDSPRHVASRPHGKPKRSGSVRSERQKSVVTLKPTWGLHVPRVTVMATRVSPRLSTVGMRSAVSVYGGDEEEWEAAANKLLADYGFKLGAFDEEARDRSELVEA